MSFVTRKMALVIFTVLVVPVVFIAGFVWTGVYNIGADDPHWRPTHALLETVRHRSIDTRASKLQAPTDLDDPARIRQGAGNYDAMCSGCHLAPGMSETELSKGLYPAPPNLTKASVDAAHAFWVIKHGIKASGMPAWGKSMEDAYIWNMAAFLQQLPTLNAQQYQALVASSGGHSHGGGETRSHGSEGMPMDAESTAHAHAAGAPPSHDEPPVDKEGKPHAHSPGMPPHDDSPEPAAKPHTPGTPPHNDTAPAEPAAAKPSSEETPPEPAASGQNTHDDHNHQH